MSKVYDAAYKLFFSNQTLFRQLLETFVAQDWVKQLDFDRCEKLEKSFVSENYRQIESDLVYRVGLQDSVAYICILLEFQSTVQHFMAMRVANYVTSFYMELLASDKKIKQLPPVFSIVLYNGKRKWTAPENTRMLMAQPELIGKFALDLNYFKIDVNELSEEHLRQASNAVAYLFLSETQHHIDTLAVELAKLFDKQEDRQALSLILNWFEQLAVHGKIERVDFEKLTRVYSSKQEVDMIVDSMRKFKQMAFEEGKIEGMQQGIQHNTFEITRAMLSEQLDIRLIMKLTGLSEAEVLQIKNVTF